MSDERHGLSTMVDQHRRLVEQGTAHYIERCELLAGRALAKLEALGPSPSETERDELIALAGELKKSAREFLSVIDSYRKLTRQLTDFAQEHQRTARRVVKALEAKDGETETETG